MKDDKIILKCKGIQKKNSYFEWRWTVNWNYINTLFKVAIVGHACVPVSVMVSDNTCVCRNLFFGPREEF